MASVATRFWSSGLSLAAAMLTGDLVDTLLEGGETERLSELVARDERWNPAVIDGQLARGRGLLHVRAGDLVEAEAELADGVRQLRPVGQPFALARGLLHHGNVLVELGRAHEAAPSFDEARAIFARLDARPWLERSDRALKQATAA